MEKYLKTIKNVSVTGLIGSLLIVVAVIVFRYTNYAFYQTQEIYQMLTYAALVAGVLCVGLILLTYRKNIAKLRQAEVLEEKLSGYASMIKIINFTTLFVSVVVNLCIVLSGNYILLNLAIIMVFTLFFTYPNMYKIKNDLGLDDTQMKMLFGDKYIADPVEDSDAEIVDPLAKKKDE